MREHYNRVGSTSQIQKNSIFPSSSQQPLGLIGKALPVSRQTSTERLRICRESINKAVQIYLWRSKTSLPILRVEQCWISPAEPLGHSKREFIFDASGNGNPHKWEQMSQTSKVLMEYVKNHPEVSFYEVSVKMEDCRCRLPDMNTFTFPQTMYLLKEMLVGFEVLIDIFGFFNPEEEMLTLTSNHRWKIWPNSDFKLNQVRSSSLSILDFISQLISIAERHSMSTSQSKAFFSQIKHYIHNNQITFLNTLQQVNQFILLNKILQVNKVTLSGVLCGGNDKKTYAKHENKNKSFSYQVQNGIVPIQKGSLGNNSPVFTEPQGHRTMKTGSAYFPAQMAPQNSNNMAWQASSGQLPKPRTSHYINLSKDIDADLFTPLKKQPKEVNADTSHARIPSIDLCLQEQMVQKGNKAKMSSAFKDSPVKQSRKKSFGQSQHRLSPIKFQNVFDQPYSSPLLKVTSARNIAGHGIKACVSSIYHSDKKKKLKDKKFSQNYLFYEPVQVQILTPQTPPSPVSNPQVDVKCLSPYNSSSTKELQNSREMKHSDLPNYAKLKANDLMVKERNNHSVINAYKMEGGGAEEEEGKRSLAVSHQFHDRGHHLEVPSWDRRGQVNHNNQWTSTITGLFSDTRSIKLLKASIKMKATHDEVFEKEYLKDVKLDLLDKLGRTASHVVLDEGHMGEGGFNTMQLIEEVDEIKSGLQSERDHRRRDEEESGFNFETQMYVINPSRW